MVEDPERCYQAAASKDARFDGWFVCAVTSTGIYCRPSCPARTPKRHNVRFFATVAAAQQAGFRACLRCRPDASPGSPEWNTRADVVARAMRLIHDGVVDREGVEGLAHRLAYSARQLNRLMTAELGTGPLAVARAQRGQTARLLLETTDLPVSHVAFAAGFSSVRQCNETMRRIFADTPRGLRARAARRCPVVPSARASDTRGVPTAIRLRLPSRQPFDPTSLLRFLGRRAVPGVESWDGVCYRRSLRLPRGHAVVSLRAQPDDGSPAAVECRLDLSDLRDLTAAVSRCRRLLDLDADPVAIAEVLGTDPALRRLVSRQPGRRVPGAADGFELAVRAVVGQQISVTGARTVAGKLAQAVGDTIPGDGAGGGDAGVALLFPTPDALIDLARRRPEVFAMPASRRGTLVTVARAVRDGDLEIDAGSDPRRLRSALVALSGIGPWTAEYVTMRALRDPDAFLPTDLGARRAAGALGLPEDTVGLEAHSARWRPWRSYAMAHLWGDA